MFDEYNEFLNLVSSFWCRIDMSYIQRWIQGQICLMWIGGIEGYFDCDEMIDRVGYLYINFGKW